MQNGGQPMQMPGRAPGNNMQPMINIPPMNNMSMLPVGNNMMRPMMQLNRPSQHMVTAHGTYAQGSGWNNSAAMVMPHAQLVHPSQASSSSLEGKMLAKARGLAGDCCRMAPEPRWVTGEE